MCVYHVTRRACRFGTDGARFIASRRYAPLHRSQHHDPWRFDDPVPLYRPTVRHRHRVDQYTGSPRAQAMLRDGRDIHIPSDAADLFLVAMARIFLIPHFPCCPSSYKSGLSDGHRGKLLPSAVELAYVWLRIEGYLGNVV